MAETRKAAYAKVGKEFSEMQFEECVLCGTLTNVPIVQEVEYRAFYMEGAGQLCYDCYKKLYS